RRRGNFQHVCTFWLVEALTRAGRLEEARFIYEKTGSGGRSSSILAQTRSTRPTSSCRWCDRAIRLATKRGLPLDHAPLLVERNRIYEAVMGIPEPCCTTRSA